MFPQKIARLSVHDWRLGCAWVTSTEWNFCEKWKCFWAMNKPVSSPVDRVCRPIFLIWSSYFSFVYIFVCLVFFKKSSSRIIYCPDKWSNGVLGAAVVDCNHLVRFLLQFFIILSYQTYRLVLESSTHEEKFLKIQRCPRSLPSLMLLIWYAYLVISNNIWFLLYLQCRRLLLFTSSSLDLPQRLYSAFHWFKKYWFHIFAHVQQPANSRIKRSCQGLWLDAIGSTVQKAVVVLAATPVFGPIRYVRTSIFSFSRILFLF